MKLSNFPPLRAYPNVQRLVRGQLDMQLEDAKTLLQLPRPVDGLPGGCNLTLASLLFNIVGGASYLFYDASMEDIEKKRGSGRRFKRVLAKHYPFDEDDVRPASEAARLLYEEARNPLAHMLGVGKDLRFVPGAPTVNNRPVAIEVSKGPLTAEQVDRVISSRTRLLGMEPTVRLAGGVCTINAVTLAWGVHEMLRRLFEADAEATKAEALAAQYFNGPMPPAA